MFYVLGALVIAAGLYYRFYKLRIAYKNRQAKEVIEEIKRRVDDGEEKEEYLNILDEASFSIDLYKVLKNSPLSEEELRELSRRSLNDKKDTGSKVIGLSKLSLRIGKVVIPVSFLVGLLFFLNKQMPTVSVFVYALMVSQISYLVTVIIVETVCDIYEKRRVIKK